jgi:hypothetical protein
VNARNAGVHNRAQFFQGDIFETDVRAATVVTMYLLPSLNVKMMPILKRQLRNGARIVSQSFDMQGEWEPDRTITVAGRSVYLWIVRK